MLQSMRYFGQQPNATPMIFLLQSFVHISRLLFYFYKIANALSLPCLHIEL